MRRIRQRVAEAMNAKTTALLMSAAAGSKHAIDTIRARLDGEEGDAAIRRLAAAALKPEHDELQTARRYFVAALED